MTFYSRGVLNWVQTDCASSIVVVFHRSIPLPLSARSEPRGDAWMFRMLGQPSEPLPRDDASPPWCGFISDGAGAMEFVNL